jgi:hypothetical protein
MLPPALDVSARQHARLSFEIAVGEELRRVRLQRLFRVEHERQRLVPHLDEPHGLLRRLLVHGGDGGGRLAGEADAIVQEVGPIAPDGDLRRVVVRDDRLDARERLGPARVDAGDARVGVRAAEDAGDEHARQLEVGGVLRLTGDALDRVDDRSISADHPESACGVLLLRHGASYACIRRDAVMTDSRMRL